MSETANVKTSKYSEGVIAEMLSLYEASENDSTTANMTKIAEAINEKFSTTLTYRMVRSKLIHLDVYVPLPVVEKVAKVQEPTKADFIAKIEAIVGNSVEGFTASDLQTANKSAITGVLALVESYQEAV